VCHLVLCHGQRLLGGREHTLRRVSGTGLWLDIPTECIVDLQVVHTEGMLHRGQVAELIKRLPAGELRVLATLVASGSASGV